MNRKLKTLYCICILEIFILQFCQLHSKRHNFIKQSERNKIFETAARIIDYSSTDTYFGALLIRDCNNCENTILKKSFDQYISFIVTQNDENFLPRRYKDGHKVFVIDAAVVRKTVHSANIIVTVVSSHEHFTRLLTDLKGSIYWNHNAYFVIVNDEFRDNCESAPEFLNTIWTFRILNGIYLCTDMNNTLRLFSFNPYNRVAPKFWNVIGPSNSSNNYWTLLEHQFPKTDENPLTNELYFDKSQDLNGYNMKAVTCITHNGSIQYNFNKPINFKRFVGVEYDVFDEVRKEINATLTMKVSAKCGWINEKKIPEGSFKDVLLDGTDIAINPTFIRDFLRYQSYPYYNLKLSIVTLNVELNSGEQILKIFTIKVWLIWAAVFVSLIVTLKYYLGITLSSAFLELLRLLVNTSVTRHPRNASDRILFTTTVYTFLVINTFMQCRLSQMNTIAEYKASVDSIDDLIKSDLKVYGNHFYRRLVHETIRKRYELSHITDCFKMLLNGERVACVHENKAVRFYVYETKLIHIAKECLFERGIVFIFSEDSPFLRKFDSIVQRMREGGFVKLYYLRQQSLYLRDPNSDNGKKPLDFKKITIAFQILLGGLVLSSMTMLMELVTQ